MDRVVGLLETPPLTFVRLHLLRPAAYPSLLRRAPHAAPFTAPNTRRQVKRNVDVSQWPACAREGGGSWVADA